MLIVLIFFVVTTILFFRAAKRYQHREFMEHRRRFYLQAFGISFAIGINLYFTISFLTGHSSDKKEPHFDSNRYLIQQMFQILGIYIMILSKSAKDCFFCFTKIKNIKYSIFQYVTYVYTEQMREVQRNAYKIWAKLNANKTMHNMNIVLDIDDYLNPKETIDRYMMGVDMQFMVERVGGTVFKSDCTTESEINYHENEASKSDNVSSFAADNSMREATFATSVAVKPNDISVVSSKMRLQSTSVDKQMTLMVTIEH